MRQTAFPGNELKEKREELGLSLSDASEETLVRVVYLQAFEDGDTASLPPACYAVGFLKTYCGLLGVDPNRYVDALHASIRPASGGFLRRTRNRKGQLRPVTWANDAITWAVITALLVLGWLAYDVVLKPKDDINVEASTIEMRLPPPDSAPMP